MDVRSGMLDVVSRFRRGELGVARGWRRKRALVRSLWRRRRILAGGMGGWSIRLCPISGGCRSWRRPIYEVVVKGISPCYFSGYWKSESTGVWRLDVDCEEYQTLLIIQQK